MKKLAFLMIVIITLSSIENFAQRGPLRGSGVPKTLSFDNAGYDKLNLLDFEGRIQIEVGKKHSVKIEIDDNLAELVQFNLNTTENELTVSVAGNKNGRLYLEDINSKVVITMPETSVIKHRGNSNVFISGISGLYFRMEQQGNGDVMITGNIDEFDISKTGNGTVFGEKLVCNKANITSIGNGNVKINAIESFTVKGAGNGDVIQTGEGTASFFQILWVMVKL